MNHLHGLVFSLVTLEITAVVSLPLVRDNANLASSSIAYLEPLQYVSDANMPVHITIRYQDNQRELATSSCKAVIAHWPHNLPHRPRDSGTRTKISSHLPRASRHGAHARQGLSQTTPSKR